MLVPVLQLLGSMPAAPSCDRVLACSDDHIARPGNVLLKASEGIVVDPVMVAAAAAGVA